MWILGLKGLKVWKCSSLTYGNCKGFRAKGSSLSTSWDHTEGTVNLRWTQLASHPGSRNVPSTFILWKQLGYQLAAQMDPLAASWNTGFILPLPPLKIKD